MKDPYPLRTYCRTLKDKWQPNWTFFLLIPFFVFLLPLAIAWEVALLSIMDAVDEREFADKTKEKA